MPHLNMNDDPDDVALNAGQSIFVEADPYWRYMSGPNVSKAPDVCSCSVWAELLTRA